MPSFSDFDTKEVINNNRHTFSFDPDHDEATKEYRKRIHAFFMELVSTRCFSDNVPLGEDVCRWLLSYVTGEKTLTVREGRAAGQLSTQTDPTYVALLQLLIQNR